MGSSVVLCAVLVFTLLPLISSFFLQPILPSPTERGRITNRCAVTRVALNLKRKKGDRTPGKKTGQRPPPSVLTNTHNTKNDTKEEMKPKLEEKGSTTPIAQAEKTLNAKASDKDSEAISTKNNDAISETSEDTAYDLVGAVVERRELLAVGGLGVLVVAVLGSAFGPGDSVSDPGSAVAKMRARRKAVRGDEPTTTAPSETPVAAARPGPKLPKKLVDDEEEVEEDEEDADENVLERIQTGKKDMEKVGQRVAAGASSAFATAKSVGQGVASATSSAYTTGQTAIKKADEVLEIHAKLACMHAHVCFITAL